MLPPHRHSSYSTPSHASNPRCPLVAAADFRHVPDAADTSASGGGEVSRGSVYGRACPFPRLSAGSRPSNNNNKVSERACGPGRSVSAAAAGSKGEVFRVRIQREFRLRTRTCRGRRSGQAAIRYFDDRRERHAIMAMKKLLQRATAYQDALPAGE